MTHDEIVALWREHKEVHSFARAVEKITKSECADALDRNAKNCINPLIRGVLQANAKDLREGRQA